METTCNYSLAKRNILEASGTISENMNQIRLIMSRTWLNHWPNLFELPTYLQSLPPTQLRIDPTSIWGARQHLSGTSTSQASNCQAETTRTAAASETVCCAAPAVRPMELQHSLLYVVAVAAVAVVQELPDESVRGLWPAVSL